MNNDVKQKSTKRSKLYSIIALSVFIIIAFVFLFQLDIIRDLIDLEGSISILGEKGSVVIGGFAVNKMESWAFEEELDGDNKVLEQFSVNPPNVYGFGHQAYYEHVVECISGDGKNLVDGLQGRKSIELINAIYESVETGKEVFLRYKPQKFKLGQS